MASEVIRSYFDSGALEIESELHDGIPHGYCRIFYESGGLKQETIRVKGLLNGMCRQWAEDGKLLGSFEFIHGVGTFIEWHPNGQKKVEFSMAAGLSEGATRVYDIHGNCVLEQWFLKGTKVSKKAYDAKNSGPK